jgi:transposase-like protein
MEERLRIAGRLLESMSDMCREFGISRKTGYKIYRQLDDLAARQKGGQPSRGCRGTRALKIRRAKFLAELDDISRS